MATDNTTSTSLIPEPLPDDPRDCCREILKLCLDDAYQFPHDAYPSALADLGELIFRASEQCDLDEIARYTLKPLELLSYHAGKTIRDWEARQNAIWGLARHGGGDHRDYDRGTADRLAKAS